MMDLARKTTIIFSLFFFLLAGVYPAISSFAKPFDDHKTSTASIKTGGSVHSTAISELAGNGNQDCHKKVSAIKQRTRSKRSTALSLPVEPAPQNSLSFVPPKSSDGLYHQSTALLPAPSLQNLRTMVLLI